MPSEWRLPPEVPATGESRYRDRDARRAYKRQWRRDHIEEDQAYFRSVRDSRRENNRRWREAHPDLVRDQELRRRYGITLVEHKAMHTGVCPCGEAILYEETRTDHCHECGVVLGLVHDGCNKAMGFVSEPARLRALADYMEGHQHGG